MILNLGEVMATDEAIEHIDRNYMMAALSWHGIGLGSTDSVHARTSTHEWNGAKFLIITEDERTHVFLLQEG